MVQRTYSKRINFFFLFEGVGIVTASHLLHWSRTERDLSSEVLMKNSTIWELLYFIWRRRRRSSWAPILDSNVEENDSLACQTKLWGPVCLLPRWESILQTFLSIFLNYRQVTNNKCQYQFRWKLLLQSQLLTSRFNSPQSQLIISYFILSLPLTLLHISLTFFIKPCIF